MLPRNHGSTYEPISRLHSNSMPNEAGNLTRSRWLFKVFACCLGVRGTSRARYLVR